MQWFGAVLRVGQRPEEVAQLRGLGQLDEVVRAFGDERLDHLDDTGRTSCSPPSLKSYSYKKRSFTRKWSSLRPDVPGVPRVPETTQPRDAELLAVDAEAMKVIVTPGKGDLDDIVEVGEVAV
jgi:hypothetical protein